MSNRHLEFLYLLRYFRFHRSNGKLCDFQNIFFCRLLTRPTMKIWKQHFSAFFCLVLANVDFLPVLNLTTNLNLSPHCAVWCSGGFCYWLLCLSQQFFGPYTNYFCEISQCWEGAHWNSSIAHFYFVRSRSFKACLG